MNCTKSSSNNAINFSLTAGRYIVFYGGGGNNYPINTPSFSGYSSIGNLYSSNASGVSSGEYIGGQVILKEVVLVQSGTLTITPNMFWGALTNMTTFAACIIKL